MANKADALLTDYLYERWNAVSAPAAGTTCVANVGATGMPAYNRIMIEMISFSARNVTAAAVTLTLSARAASIAGTSLGSWDFIVGANASIQDCYSQVNIAGIRGQDVFLEFGTPQASVTQKISASGWKEVSQTP